MYRIWTDYGCETIYREDLPNFIEDYVGRDLAVAVKELILESDETSNSMSEEINKLSSTLEGYKQTKEQIDNAAKDLMEYLLSAEIINRGTLIEYTKSIALLSEQEC